MDKLNELLENTELQNFYNENKDKNVDELEKYLDVLKQEHYDKNVENGTDLISVDFLNIITLMEDRIYIIVKLIYEKTPDLKDFRDHEKTLEQLYNTEPQYKLAELLKVYEEDQTKLFTDNLEEIFNHPKVRWERKKLEILLINDRHMKMEGTKLQDANLNRAINIAEEELQQTLSKNLKNVKIRIKYIKLLLHLILEYNSDEESDFDKESFVFDTDSSDEEPEINGGKKRKTSRKKTYKKGIIRKKTHKSCKNNKNRSFKKHCKKHKKNGKKH